MKKTIAFIALLMALIMTLGAMACTSPNANKPGSKADEPTVSEAPDGLTTDKPVSDDTPVNLLPDPEWKFGRTDYSETAAARKPLVITTVEDFRRDILPQLREALRADAEAAYNEEFFESNHLIAFWVTYSSGSVQPEVTSVEKTGDQIVITVNGRMDGDVGTCDMATHLGLVALDNRAYPVDLEIKVVGTGWDHTNEAEG
ncbi:MAG: hypothetical protein II191_04490 [Clostridia bacterium]|nr:hypothetical protein [Clostridia bacterium]